MEVREAFIDEFDALKAMVAANEVENGKDSFLAPLSDEQLLQDLKAGCCVVAAPDAGEARGMGCVRIDGLNWYVYGVYVRPDARGLGYGIEIVSKLHGIARDKGAKRGFVMASGHAEGMFDRAGYKKTANLMELA